MQIQVNTDHNIEGHEALAAEISGIVESALSRFSHCITRVEIHLSDEKSDQKVGHDAMRCMMEARLEGRQPIAVTHQAATLDPNQANVEWFTGKRAVGRDFSPLMAARSARCCSHEHRNEPYAQRFYR